MWLFEIRDQNGLNPVRLKSATKRKVSTVLNSVGQGQASFDLDLNTAEAAETNLREGRSQLFVYKDDTLYWSGKIMIASNDLSAKKEVVSVTALGWTWPLEKRYIGKNEVVNYVIEDLSDILWDVINDSQQLTGGDLGITVGSLATSKNLTISYERQVIKDVIDSLVSQGIDFEVTPNKILNTYYPKGIDRSDTIKFKYPGNIKQIKSKNPN